MKQRGGNKVIDGLVPFPNNYELDIQSKLISTQELLSVKQERRGNI